MLRELYIHAHQEMADHDSIPSCEKRIGVPMETKRPMSPEEEAELLAWLDQWLHEERLKSHRRDARLVTRAEAYWDAFLPGSSEIEEE